MNTPVARAHRFSGLLGVLAILSAILMALPVTPAAPLPRPEAVTVGPTSAASDTVPDGACYAAINARSAPATGGSDGTAGNLGTNGNGVTIDAVFPVVPGESYSIFTETGGAGDAFNRDGDGGTGGEAVAVAFGGAVLVAAGGGGGAGSSTGLASGRGGNGGHAGVPTGWGFFRELLGAMAFLTAQLSSSRAQRPITEDRVGLPTAPQGGGVGGREPRRCWF
ncbi:MAG: hypothetical protein H6512_12375 [Acidimicrobiia bacterium]|nr:hypothetical protein [Acidimicrobiia bacterium]